MGLEILFGALSSVVVEGIKRAAGTSGWVNAVAMLIVSVIAAVIYHYLVATANWETVVMILGSSQIVYGFIMKQLPK